LATQDVSKETFEDKLVEALMPSKNEIVGWEKDGGRIRFGKRFTPEEQKYMVNKSKPFYMCDVL
jgi:hypothetical protein